MVMVAKFTSDSQNSDTTALSGRELYHLQFSLQAANPETFGYTRVQYTVRLNLPTSNESRAPNKNIVLTDVARIFDYITMIFRQLLHRMVATSSKRHSKIERPTAFEKQSNVLMPHRHDSAKCVNAIISHEKASDNSNSG
jgi:hypothetical protein